MNATHNESPPSSSNSNPRLNNNPGLCKYHKNGNCKYGKQCRYTHPQTQQHPTPQRAHSSSTTTQQSSTDSPSKQPETSTVIRTTRVIPSEDWVKAPEFIPSGIKAVASPPKTTFKSYAQVVKPDGACASSDSGATGSSTVFDNDGASSTAAKLCPYAEANGECRYPPNECSYVHGDICDLCGVAALHPHDPNQRKRHQHECISQHEKDMELSFAVARSREKSCGVCFEVILEKSTGEQRFGILPNCNHCFCLSCIRKWRQAKQFDSKIIRACPECRVTSDFVCPSMYWVDTKEEKEKLITDYKGALRGKDCKYFKMGRGKCPFGNKCFYLHALPDGTKVDVGPPVRHRRPAHDGEIDVLGPFLLWDVLGERANRWIYSLEDLEDLVAFFSDSDDSDWSEYEIGSFE